MMMTFALLPVENIALVDVLYETPGWDVYRRRRRLAVEDMAESIRRHGQLAPVLLEELPGGGCRIVDGFRRVAACRSLGRTGVAAQVIRHENAGPRTLFVWALHRGCAGGITGLTDRIVTISGAKQLQMPRERILEEVLPALGLESDGRALDDLEKMAGLSEEVLDAFDDDRISEAQLRALAKVEEPARGMLFREVFLDSRLSVSETRQVITLLEELLARDDCPMERNLSMLLGGDLDERRPERARQLLSCLRRLRYPSILTIKAMFKEAGASLRSARGVTVADAGDFERNDVTVSLTFSSPADCAKQIDVMKKALDAGDVKKLLDIVQGANW